MPHRPLVKGGIDPGNLKFVRALRELQCRSGSEPVLEESHGLDQDIIVSQKTLSVGQDAFEEIESLAMPIIGSVRERIKSGSIDEDQRRLFGRNASASASSWRSDTGASLL